MENELDDEDGLVLMPTTSIRALEDRKWRP
jgi:hypothetical protein